MDPSPFRLATGVHSPAGKAGDNDIDKQRNNTVARNIVGITFSFLAPLEFTRRRVVVVSCSHAVTRGAEFMIHRVSDESEHATYVPRIPAGLSAAVIHLTFETEKASVALN